MHRAPNTCRCVSGYLINTLCKSQDGKKSPLSSEPVMQNADKARKDSVALLKAPKLEVFFPSCGFFFFFLARGRENNKCGGRNEHNWQIRVRKYGMEKQGT